MVCILYLNKAISKSQILAAKYMNEKLIEVKEKKMINPQL